MVAVALRCSFLFLFGFVVTTRAAAPATNAAEGRERDLGFGLAYHRVQQLPADLPPTQESRPQACVVDLRYVGTNSAGARAFQAWLAAQATPRTPVLVLANADTDGSLLALMRGHEPSAGVMWIGIASRNFNPDVAVQGTSADERRAYDAFEKGATIASLLTDNPGKIRYDETSLGKDHRSEPPAGPSGNATAKDAPPALPIDAVLQRAVHVHRGLLALRKL